MYYYKEELINLIEPDQPDPAAAKVLQFGEMNGGPLAATDPPAGFPVPELPEMPNEHSPGIAGLSR